MKPKNILLILFLVLFAWYSVAYARYTGAFIGDFAPEFSLKTMDGAAVNMSELKGKKPLLIVFWATWCSNCKSEIPKINKLYNQFKPKGLELLAVNVGVNDSLSRTGSYVKKYGLNYPVAFDEGSVVTNRFLVQGVPTVVIIDKNGIIQYRSRGVPDDLEQNYKRLVE